MPRGIVYYQARDGSVPAEAFLDSCPLKVEATILAVLEAVRQAPPPLFSGGGKWEAMHGLIDEYEFVVHPRLAGHGPTLFAGLSKHVDLR